MVMPEKSHLFHQLAPAVHHPEIPVAVHLQDVAERIRFPQLIGKTKALALQSRLHFRVVDAFEIEQLVKSGIETLFLGTIVAILWNRFPILVIVLICSWLAPGRAIQVANGPLL